MLREHLHTHLIKCNHFFASLLFQLSFTSIDLTNFFPRVYLLRKYIFENTFTIIIHAGFLGSKQKYFHSSSEEALLDIILRPKFPNFYQSFLFLRYKYSSIPSRKI